VPLHERFGWKWCVPSPVSAQAGERLGGRGSNRESWYDDALIQKAGASTRAESFGDRPEGSAVERVRSGCRTHMQGRSSCPAMEEVTPRIPSRRFQEHPGLHAMGLPFAFIPSGRV
jgi:hypothetical protein